MAKIDFSAEVAENYEQKCLCVIVVDASESMQGDAINETNKALNDFYNEISSDETTTQRLELAVVVFNHSIQLVQEPALVENTVIPVLKAEGPKQLAGAVNMAIDIVAKRKQWYKATSQPYYRPWIILMSDGKFHIDSDIELLSHRIKEDTQNRRYEFLPVGVVNSNIQNLNILSGHIQTIRLRDIKFSSFFKWLSASIGIVITEEKGIQVDIPSGADWMDAFMIDEEDSKAPEITDCNSSHDNSDWLDSFVFDGKETDTLGEIGTAYNIDNDIPLNKPIENYIPQLPKEKGENKEDLLIFFWRKLKTLMPFNKKGLTQEVFCSVFAPSEVKKRAHLLTQIFLHLENDIEKVCTHANTADVRAEKRGYIPLSYKISNGDAVDFCFNVYGDCLLANYRKTIIWDGTFKKCVFDFYVPENVKTENLYCEVSVYLEKILVGELNFVTDIVNSPEHLNVNVKSHMYKRIFISYAHQDAAIANNIALAYKAQGVDYFFDHDKLNAGDVFEDIIFKYIDLADLFILCWSKNAAMSEYVEMERKYALQKAYPQKSLQEATLKIYPVCIPPEAELPKDMKDIYHFELLQR